MSNYRRMLFCVLLSKFFYQVWALIDKHFSWHVLLSNFFYQVCAYVDKHFFHQKQCKLSAPKSVCRYFEQIVEKITSVMYFEKCLSTSYYITLRKILAFGPKSVHRFLKQKVFVDQYYITLRKILAFGPKSVHRFL